MCSINPLGGLLTSGSKGRAAALGGIAGTLIAGGKKKKTGEAAAASPAVPTATTF